MINYDCKIMHNFRVVNQCEYNHCGVCGECQAINGCAKIIKRKYSIFEKSFPSLEDNRLTIDGKLFTCKFKDRSEYVYRE